MATVDVRREEDFFAVRSRVSWGAIFAGAAVAVSLYILLNLFGLAIGLSVGDDPGRIGTPTAVWAVIAGLLSLFIGGWVTTQCTIGENRFEAALYGLVLWGVLFAVLAWFAAMGVRLGLNAMMVPGAQQGMQQQMQQAQPEGAAPAAPMQPQEMPGETIAAGAWWAFFGTLLSMIASIAGAILGTGTRLTTREPVRRPSAALGGGGTVERPTA